MIGKWKNLILMLLINVMMVGHALSAEMLFDNISDSVAGESSVHDIRFNPDLAYVVHDGSVKIDFDSDFQFDGITLADVNVSGGDVVWKPVIIDSLHNVIVAPFLGDMDSSDGTIRVEIGGVHNIRNPLVTDIFTEKIGIYSSEDGSGVSLDDGQISLAIIEGVTVNAVIPESIIFQVNGAVVGTEVNGEVTDVTTDSNNIDFGQTYGATDLVAAQELMVLTNATNGYNVTLEYNHPLRSGIYEISDWLGTNMFPTSWASPSGAQNGYFGYTTSDTSLGVLPADRFWKNKWAGLWTLPVEVMYHNGPADGVREGVGKTEVGYRLEVTNWQESGIYSNTVTYVCTPFY